MVCKQFTKVKIKVYQQFKYMNNNEGKKERDQNAWNPNSMKAVQFQANKKSLGWLIGEIVIILSFQTSVV